ncbi:MAG: xanthine dehydrogenase family protein molybdopterin-binding subunit, partial [Actinomycetota bacterium]
MSILGNRVRRREDPKFLTVGGTYVADVRDPLLEDALHVTYVRSTMAHARITVDGSDAAQADGVVAVFTGADVDLPPLLPEIPLLNQSMVRPFLATDTVRFVGEPIAAILTEHAYQGPDAVELVVVDYDPLPVIVDPEAAAGNTTVLHPDAGSNVAFEFPHADDDPFADCEAVVSERVVNQRLAACPLEVRSDAAAWTDDGRLHHWAASQHPQGVRDRLCQLYGLDPSQVRVLSPDVGGGFGAKIGAYPEELMLGWLARRVGRPVRFTETRTENMLAMGHGRGQVQRVTIGGTRDGVVQAYRLEIVQDSGAYPSMGGILPFLTNMMAPGVYRIPVVQVASQSVVTNTTPTTAYRGAGRPEAAAAIERAMDLFAAEIGMDPAEVRRRNLIPADAFPYSTPTGATYDVGDYERALDLVMDAAGYAELRAEQARRRDAGGALQLGIGISIYVEVTGGPSAGSEHAKVQVRPDGSAVVYTGTSPHGQGHETAWAMIASEELGIPMDQISVVHGDTDLVPIGGGTMGSRSLQLGGSAVHQAAAQTVEQARHLAAELLEASPDDIVLDKIEGRFHVAGTPAVSKTWAEVAGDDGLAVDTDFAASAPTFPFGAHLAVVEVDLETGRVRLDRMVTVDDAGRVLNPLLVEGQRHGGIAQGAAQALLEEMRYDDDGNPVTSNFADYAMISATELPSFELVSMETPTPINPLGAKGIGESGTIGSTPALQSAVVDA